MPAFGAQRAIIEKFQVLGIAQIIRLDALEQLDRLFENGSLLYPGGFKVFIQVAQPHT